MRDEGVDIPTGCRRPQGCEESVGAGYRLVPTLSFFLRLMQTARGGCKPLLRGLARCGYLLE